MSRVIRILSIQQSIPFGMLHSRSMHQKKRCHHYANTRCDVRRSPELPERVGAPQRSAADTNESMQGLNGASRAGRARREEF